VWRVEGPRIGLLGRLPRDPRCADRGDSRGGWGRRCRSAVSSARADIAALAVHLMMNTAITGATFEIDGGQQLVQS
jgi:hypothetical protein